MLKGAQHRQTPVLRNPPHPRTCRGVALCFALWAAAQDLWAQTRRTEDPVIWFAAGESAQGADALSWATTRALCEHGLVRLASFFPGEASPGRGAIGRSLRVTFMLEACVGVSVGESRCPVGLDENVYSAHIVWLAPFGLDRTEVTVEAYRRCVAQARCRPPRRWPVGGADAAGRWPIAEVSYDDAVTYCAWVGGRLPTEAEWERAARGTQARLFPWGELYDDRRANVGALRPGCVYDGDGHEALAPVASYASGATPEGVYDLSGNVAEWVSDRFGREGSDPRLGTRLVAPEGPAAGAMRVVRGGSYLGPAWAQSNLWRMARAPGDRAPDLGFRCAYDR